ncbi:MAG: NADH-quinone oxidoreductase subunit C [Candidatus Omnitrophica bacterium]|nr:NADH-quinone oxidoreductase subunit C [Candidatus Omnitrophota bacterium]
MNEDKLNNLIEKFKEDILNIKTHSEKRIYIDIKDEAIVNIVEFMFKQLGFRFSTASGVDTPWGIEILYHFSWDNTGKIISLRVIIKDKNKPKISSITPVIRGAEWIEREIWELLGVEFVGHPNLRHLLLIDDWPANKYPLRKDK